MNRVIHFEVAADDPEKTVAFYQEIFDWESTRGKDPKLTGWLRPAPRIKRASTAQSCPDGRVGRAQSIRSKSLP